MATNPPITIGPFANVPAPGSGVKSDWAQQISTYVAPTPWVAVTFQNSWVNFGGGYQVAQYRKVGDIVYLRGSIKTGAPSSVAFTLPAGFRPATTLILPAIIGGGTVGYTTINNAGTVVPNGTGASAQYVLDGTYFSVAP